MHDPNDSWPLFRTAMERLCDYSERGTEEDHQKFRTLRKDFKKIMNEKMRLNVEDESDISLISKKFWKYVKSKTSSTLYGDLKVPTRLLLLMQYRKKSY